MSDWLTNWLIDWLIINISYFLNTESRTNGYTEYIPDDVLLKCHGSRLHSSALLLSIPRWLVVGNSSHHPQRALLINNCEILLHYPGDGVLRLCSLNPWTNGVFRIFWINEQTEPLHACADLFSFSVRSRAQRPCAYLSQSGARLVKVLKVLELRAGFTHNLCVEGRRPRRTLYHNRTHFYISYSNAKIKRIGHSVRTEPQFSE